MLYIVDTSVILSDPLALERMAGQHIVLPLVVLSELESKRNHPELGYPARTALRALESLRKQYGSITEPIPTGAGGSIRVEVNHVEDSDLPDVLKKSSQNDNRILAVAANLRKEGNEVTLLTKDLPLRLRAGIIGMPAEDYDYESTVDADFTGVQEIKVDREIVDLLHENGRVFLDEADIYQINTGIILKSYENTSALGRVTGSTIQKIEEYNPTRIKSKNAEQRIALDLLCDDDVRIVSLGGLAGSGKTVMALAAGVEAVEARRYNKILVFRSVEPVGKQDLGFLPGNQAEKMEPWSAAINDALEAFMKPNEIRDLRYEVLPLTHIRGRTLKDSFVIIDEAQNLDLMTLVTALTRIGEGSKVILTHDVNQRDNLRVGKYDGIAKVISALSGNKMFAHISLKRSERSDVAELVANSFDL